MRKKKKAVVQQKAQVGNELARVLARFLGRMQEICDTFTQPGMFRRIHPQLIAQMFETRYPALKAKLFPGMVLAKEKVVQYHKLLTKLVESAPVHFDNNKSIPLSWYLSEGMTLINAVQSMPDAFPNSVVLKHALADLFEGTESDRVIIKMLEVCVHDANVLLSDYNHVLLHADHSKTALYVSDSTTNDVLIHVFKPERIQLIIENETRTLTRIGWPDWVTNEKQDWVWAKVKPSAVGFKTGQLEIPLDVYIQNHALNKLKERLDLTPGLMHFMVFVTFRTAIKYVCYERYNLVECLLSGQRIGYFVVSLHGDKLVVRTFLFLTNDGTPEGKNLQRMFNIGKLDKEYLQIDRLPTFISYHMDKNEHLRRIFTEAGCGSLFKLGYLEEFSKNEIKDKDPESITRYLADTGILTPKDPEADEQQDFIAVGDQAQGGSFEAAGKGNALGVGEADADANADTEADMKDEES